MCTTILNNLKDRDVLVERYNLTNNPQKFVDNKIVRDMLIKDGVEILPITMVDDAVVKTKAYPTNEEFCQLLEVTEDFLKAQAKADRTDGCEFKGGCC
jgi:hypothetical protein